MDEEAGTLSGRRRSPTLVFPASGVREAVAANLRVGATLESG